MRNLKYSEILSLNRSLQNSSRGSLYRIALLSNIVVAQLKEILEFALRREGINAEVTLGEFDNIAQDSVRFNDVNAVVIFWEVANSVEGLHANIEAMELFDVDKLGSQLEQEVEWTLGNLKHVPLVLINRFSATIFNSYELRDGRLRKLCARLNDYVAKIICNNQLVVDVDRIFAQIGLGEVVDFRQFQSSKALYKVSYLKAYAEQIAPAMRAVNGRTRKVLVMDCDNSLWGGILGEDGENGIRINDLSLDGRVFREVQWLLKGFRCQGILLALCSKNNAEDVEWVLKNHPDMVLRDNDFVAKKVNWQDKAANLQELARELNLGLDSMVLIDDSDFELGLVAKQLPGVRCVRVPTPLSLYPSLIREIARDFFVLHQTVEDMRKTEMYQVEQLRRKSEKQHSTIDDYLRSLGLIISVSWGHAVPAQRAAQMSQKTNQFNLTTRRYTAGDIEYMLADEALMVATFSVEDGHGDSGVTGLLITRRGATPDIIIVDSFLMSCRVIGRKIEWAFFDYLITKLRLSGIQLMIGEYIRTPRNDQVSGFYSSLGFDCRYEDQDKREYSLRLDEYRPSGIDYIKVQENADRKNS